MVSVRECGSRDTCLKIVRLACLGRSNTHSFSFLDKLEEEAQKLGRRELKRRGERRPDLVTKQ